MKGIILAGGKGTRLAPLTKVTSKQLLPVYNRPMIAYPLETLLRAGITEVCIVVAPEHAGDYLAYLGSGNDFGAKFTYEIQDEPLGLAHGLSLAESFADRESVAFILGDNIFEDDLSGEIRSFPGTGAKIFVKDVPDPHRFGVVDFDENFHVRSIEEKPKVPKSTFAQTGLYCYGSDVFENVRQLNPSARGELEITDLHNLYLRERQLTVSIVQGRWIDAGTFDALLEANLFMAEKVKERQPVPTEASKK
ncbi:MAG: sugar phosphate nucleotidyltransferase [bacterium]|nr:sugar phosphate nucleotidyltransferase [bacterium]